MNKEIYISVSITDFGNGRTECFLNQSVNDEPLDMQPISLDKARKLMWELVLAGGKKSMKVNRFNHHITMKDAYIFLPN